MPKLSSLFTNDVIKGVAIGLGVAAAGLMLAPAFRPAARAAVKTGILFFEKGREWMAEAGESFEDLVAEVRAELAEDHLRAEGLAETAQEATESANVHG